MLTSEHDPARRTRRSHVVRAPRTRPFCVCGLVVLAASAACSDPSGPTFTSSGPCDSGLAMASTDPAHAARAMGICDGLVSAAWVYPNGSAAVTGASFDIGHGLLPSFGANNVPHEGAALLALSSGTARAESQAGYDEDLDKGYTVAPAAGFPQKEASCPDVSTTGYDGIALHVVLVVPAGVRFLTFDYAYFTRDYPDWVCTSSIDQAAALISGLEGSAGIQNVLLDAAGNAMFASPTSMAACSPSGAYTCPLGTATLTGTGYSGGGGSGWLSTPDLPVTAGDTVRATFTIWDTLDHILDSGLLLDNLTWIP